MKKLMMFFVALMMAMNANAQYLNDTEKVFSEGKFYVGLSASSASLSYSKNSDWSLGLSATAGYLFLDDWMVLGKLDYQNYSNGTAVTTSLGAGVRYYFEQNGIYLAAVAKYAHAKCYDDFVPELNVGYAFFLGRHVTVEPELYYAHSFKDNDYSGFGARIGFGLYF